ncbi:transcriptional regulator with GAF, ATPase, and Fis domain/tetratricopeptide (TPR) repeat protein [Desulfosalsimonas propionicica]|uniref:Transcriptional regulator with GAF, ATPase, and Fis domain/tetratricopeptide (TPR) repeat protein n=1 Tax=Desulfosalsimonas propionicica TaxID=332175 RepID=A0A7W0CBZ0_9BACT|nr:sigma-54-dependent Fis family transcriptional regulator [Desulfosalsimonas propionicica]MBA2882929.1 transcriptional regulator with GAF, ATPase, and Fis domain/tetratricopeptide (TPR) repeat protein [Desulfosalsimonas propionicica]
MKQMDEYFAQQDDKGREITLILTLLPPPVSLNILCTITDHPPVEILQIVEDLHRSGILSRCKEKGAGYYCLSDFKSATQFINTVPESYRFRTAEKVLAGIYDYLPDGARRWMNVAHIYQVSGMPIQHAGDIVRAGHYCCEQNLPIDAAEYFQLALESMEKTELDREGAKAFIDAVIGLCTCRDTALSKDIQQSWLIKALAFNDEVNAPLHCLKLKVLLAKTFIRTSASGEAKKLLEQAWQMLSKHEFPGELKILVALANSELLFWQGYLNEAIDRYESVIGNHEELPLDVETLKSCVRLGWTYGVAGETARGVGLARSVRRRARQMGAQDLERYATLVLVIILSDAGRLDEGEAFLEEVFSSPAEFLDSYTLWPGNGKKAFFAYRRGEYEKAFHHLSQAWENSKVLGTPHHRGPDNLEVMLGLEERGMIHPEWNFESDIERLLSWPDIYMKGVAFRFKALKAFYRGGPSEQIRADLKQSIALLSRAGAKIELSQAKILLARVMIRENESSRVAALLKSAWDVFSKINPDLFPKDLKPYLDRKSKHAFWVQSLLEIGDAIGTIRTREQLFSQIIKHAMRIAGAERGCIFLRQDGQLKMVASRNIEINEIDSDAFGPQMQLIHQVFETGEQVIQRPDACQPHQDHNLHIKRRTGCFPVRLKDRVMGVIYIDRGPTQLQLPEDEISLLGIISNQAAVAIENMEAYEEISDLKSDLEAETHFYRNHLEASSFQTQMIGRSKPFKKMINLIQQVADSDTTVMITGETGVGKELVAQALHHNNFQLSGPFIAVNIVSLSPELIASELFGHEKGAFTGASQARKGRFELASEGTLFLDDIDAFSLDIQAKMLRVLETREFERVGGTRTLKTRFRLVAASNCNIEDLVRQGLFRSDFYYRLNVFPIHIPALRERPEDIPLLARSFMNKFGKKFGKAIDRISKKDMEALMHYPWPGNIRELRHVIERAVLLSRSNRLELPPLNPQASNSLSDPDEKILPLKEVEAQHIIRALSACHGKVSGSEGAAVLLDIKPTTLYSKIKRMGIKRDDYKMGAL